MLLSSCAKQQQNNHQQAKPTHHPIFLTQNFNAPIIFASMKIVAFLMAFYILALSLMPCSDMHNECKDSKAKTEISQNHNHNQDQDDHCSPFCTCACCATFFTAFSITPINLQKTVAFATDKKVAIHNFSLPSNHFGNIWQPPKV